MVTPVTIAFRYPVKVEVPPVDALGMTPEIAAVTPIPTVAPKPASPRFEPALFVETPIVWSARLSM